MRVPEDTYRIVKAMRARGKKAGLLREWLDGVKRWADQSTGQDAAALRNWLTIAQPKPFYTAAELSILWPGLKIALGMADKLYRPPHPVQLAAELDLAGLPRLRALDGSGKFKPQYGVPSEFFIVEQFDRWEGIGISQGEFENVLYG